MLVILNSIVHGDGSGLLHFITHPFLDRTFKESCSGVACGDCSRVYTSGLCSPREERRDGPPLHLLGRSSGVAGSFCPSPHTCHLVLRIICYQALDNDGSRLPSRLHL